MKILLANNHLDIMGGSERWVWTMARELIKRHEVFIYTRNKGFVYNKLMEMGCKPHIGMDEYYLQLINHTTCAQDLMPVKGYKIQTVHGLIPSLEKPSPFVDEHVGISEEIGKEYGIPVIYNPVDMSEFKMWNHPNDCDKVLSLCQGDNSELRKIFGDRLIERSKGKNAAWDLVEEINKAKFVIGIGRGVIESMACGRPVLIYDKRSYQGEKGDGWTTDKLTRNASRRHNYSGRRYDLKLQQLDLELPKFNPFDQMMYIETFHSSVKIVRQYLSMAMTS